MSNSKYGLSTRNRRMLLLRGRKNNTGVHAASDKGPSARRNNYRVMMDAMKKESPDEITEVNCSEITRNFIEAVS